MSFIQQTIKCNHCGAEMNIALGTFGTGIPKDCPNCKWALDYKVILQGWNANESKLRQCKKCFCMKDIPLGLDTCYWCLERGQAKMSAYTELLDFITNLEVSDIREYLDGFDDAKMEINKFILDKIKEI